MVFDGADDVRFLSQRVDFRHDGGLVWHCHGGANAVGDLRRGRKLVASRGLIKE
jgi:hypothetical protein